jgi:drug/metabolite transporter (DMT)-like permease
MGTRLLGIVAALTSAASWAAGSILFTRLGETLSSAAMTLLKELVSLLLLGAALAVVGFEHVTGQTVLLLAFSGLLGIALGDTLFFQALQDLGPQALVLLLTLSQIFTVVLAVAFLGDRPAPAVWGGIALVIGGVGLVLHAKVTGEKKASGLRGIVFGLGSVACMAGSTIIAKLGLDQTSALQATFIRMAAGGAGALLFGMATRRLRRWVVPLRDPRLAGAFVAAVVVVTYGGFWLSLVAIKNLDVSVANTLISVEPLFVLPLAAVFLGEKITFRTLLGTLAAVGGVALILARTVNAG